MPQKALAVLKSPRTFFTLALVLLALWVRLRHLGYSEMWVDQSVTLSIAHKWVRGGPFPLTADISSAGIYNPPLVEYLYAVPLVFSEDILSVVWWISIVNLLGILIGSLATARVFGWRAAWWAALLFVVNPWALNFARLIWMPTFVPAFASMLYACALLYFAHAPRPRYLLLGALCLSATIQVHMTSAVLIPALGLIGLCFYRRLKVWPLVVGAGLFLLSLAPYLLYQIQTRFVDLEAMRARLSDFSATNLAVILIVFDLLHSKGIYGTLGRATDLWRSLDLRWLRADDLLTLLLMGGVVTACLLARNLRRGHEPEAAGALVLLLWLLTPLPFFIYHTHYLYTYYFMYLSPALFTLLALFADQLYGWLSQRLQRSVPNAALTAFLPLALVVFQQARLAVIGQDLLAAGAAGHRRVLDVRQVLEFAQEIMEARPECQLVILEGDDFYDFRALIGEFTDPRRARFAEVGQSYVLPDPCAVYLSTTDDAEVKNWLAKVARPLPDYTIRSPEEIWTFYDLPAADRAAAVASLKTERPLGVWENGARLNHFYFEPANEGRALLLVYTWEIVTLPRGPEALSRALKSSNQLLDGQNQLVSQVDGIGRDSRDWREGDIFQTLWELPLPPDLPPGEYSLATAFYRFPEIERIPLANGEGDLLVVGRLTLPIR